MSNMLSSMARSPMGRSLLEFMDDSGLKEDWENPSDQSVLAWVTGRLLDNQAPASVIVEEEANEELLLQLKSPHGKCTVNVNTLLALAAAYIRREYVLAEGVIGHYRPEGKNNVDTENGGSS